MPTITTLLGVVVVIGLGLAGEFLFLTALARLASRHEQSMQVDLDARRARPHRSNNADPKQACVLSFSAGQRSAVLWD